MGRLTITQDDINRSKILEPGWYQTEITACEDTLAKSDKSTNTTLSFKVLSGAFKGAIVYRLFNEKAPGFAIPLLKALGVEIGEVGESGREFDLDATVGRRIEVYVKNREYEGQIRNEVVDYRPLQTA